MNNNPIFRLIKNNRTRIHHTLKLNNKATNTIVYQDVAKCPVLIG